MKQVYQIWRILLHAHDHCTSADGRMILHRLMVEVIEDSWKKEREVHNVS